MLIDQYNKLMTDPLRVRGKPYELLTGKEILNYLNNKKLPIYVTNVATDNLNVYVRDRDGIVFESSYRYYTGLSWRLVYSTKSRLTEKTCNRLTWYKEYRVYTKDPYHIYDRNGLIKLLC